MVELKENTLYSNNEIAEWFGLKSKRFSDKNQREKKLEQLKRFVDYELVGNKTKKVLIKQIYNPIYSKQGSEGYQIIEQNFEKYWNQNGKGIDTSKRVGIAMYKDKIVENLTQNTVINYTGKAKRENYGINYLTSGKKGHSIYAWGKYVDTKDGRKLVALTPQQNEIKNKLIKKYFGNTTEQQVFVQGMVDNGQITKEQAWEVLEELTNIKGNFGAFKNELELAIENKIGRGTLLIQDNLGPGAF